MKKKVLLGLLLSTALVSMAGCNNEKKNEENKGENKQEQKVETKKLSCSLADDEDQSTTRYTLTYEGDKFNKASVMLTQRFKDEKSANKAYDELKKEVEDVNKGKGVSANAQSSGTSVSASYTFTVSELDEKGKKTYEEAGLKELDGKSYDDAKSTLETAQFKCN